MPRQMTYGIPHAAAMENWGLITFRETALLASTTKSSASELLRVAVVVSHELVHQWFGDLGKPCSKTFHPNFFTDFVNTRLDSLLLSFLVQ